MWITIIGNPVDGLSFYGPFENSEEAIDFGDRNADTDWWITELSKVEVWEPTRQLRPE